jgi:hypothetical protein
MDCADSIIIYDTDSFTFDQEVTAEIYRLVLNGSYEMELAGPDRSDWCFDITATRFTETAAPQMDAEVIELILRNSCLQMFEKDDSPSAEFAHMSIDEILANCIREKVARNEAKVNVVQQREFWTEVLEPPVFSRKAKAEPVRDVGRLIKQLSHSILDHGFRGGDDELDLLKCALTLAPPTDPATRKVLLAIVGDNSSDEPVKRFGEYCDIIDKLSTKAFHAVLFFERLERALMCAQQPGLVWPVIKPIWENAAREYALLYSLNENGFRHIQSGFEGDEDGVSAVKSLTRHQLEKRTETLVRELLSQFPAADFPEPLEILVPDAWEEAHSNLIERTTLTPEEVLAIFHFLSNFGVPHLIDHSPDAARIAAMVDLLGVRLDAVAEYISAVLALGLSVRSDESEPQFDEFPRAECLEESVKASELREMVFICRSMEPVYQFVLDFDLDTTVWIIPRDGPDFWTPDHSHFLLMTLLNSGAVVEEPWLADPILLQFLPTPRARLRMAAQVIACQRGFEWTKFVNGLEIQTLGKLLPHQSFKSGNVAYPIGFVSRRNLGRVVQDPSVGWFKCEIQAVGLCPVFVVSSWEDPDLACADVTTSDAWSRLLALLPNGDKLEESTKQLKLTGDSLFGLTVNSVMEAIKGVAGGSDSSDDSPASAT